MARREAREGEELVAGFLHAVGDGATALFIAIDQKPGGVIAIADPIKATTQAALDSLRNDDIRIVMLTGDNKTTAEAVARKLGIKEIEADVLPQDKNRIVKKLTAEGRVPSRHVLELADASSGDMRLSDHAARSMI